MTEQRGSAHRTSERGQVRQHVVYRSDKPSVEDMRDGNEETTGEGYGQQKTHHGRSLADLKWVPSHAASPDVVIQAGEPASKDTSVK